MVDPHPPQTRKKVTPEQAGDDALVYAYAVRHPGVSISGIAAVFGWSFERVDRAIAVYLQEKLIICKEGSAYDRFLPFARHPFLAERRRYYFSRIAAFLEAPARTLELAILAHTYWFTKRADGSLTLEEYDSTGQQVRKVRVNACAHCHTLILCPGDNATLNALRDEIAPLRATWDIALRPLCAHCQAALATEGDEKRFLEALPPISAPEPQEFACPPRIPGGIRRLLRKTPKPPDTRKNGDESD
jgi:hypothetical protein